MNADQAYQKGLEVMEHLMGAAGRDRVVNWFNEFDPDLARLVVEHAFGKVWTRPGLDTRSRSLITMATLAALNRGPQLRVHIRGAQSGNSGEGDCGIISSCGPICRVAGDGRGAYSRPGDIRGAPARDEAIKKWEKGSGLAIIQPLLSLAFIISC